MSEYIVSRHIVALISIDLNLNNPSIACLNKLCAFKSANNQNCLGLGIKVCSSAAFERSKRKKNCPPIKTTSNWKHRTLYFIKLWSTWAHIALLPTWLVACVDYTYICMYVSVRLDTSYKIVNSTLYSESMWTKFH